MSADTAAPPTTRRQPSSSTTTSRTPAPSAPRPPCTIHPSAIISDKVTITGTHPVTIGENTVLHPFAKITSSHAPVRIGRNCIISERSVVGLAERQHDLGVDAVVAIGDNVTIETGATVEGMLVGEGSTIDVNATIRPGAQVGKFCKVACFCTVASGQVLPDYIVIYGENRRRVNTTAKTRPDVRELNIKGQAMHIDTLKRLIPSNTAKWVT